MPRCVNVLVLLLGTESAFARSCEHPLAAAECANALQYRHSGDAHGLSFPTDRSGAWGADQPRRMGRPRMSFEQSPEGQGVAKLFEDHDRRVLLNLGAYLCEFQVNWPVAEGKTVKPCPSDREETRTSSKDLTREKGCSLSAKPWTAGPSQQAQELLGRARGAAAVHQDIICNVDLLTASNRNCGNSSST